MVYYTLRQLARQLQVYRQQEAPAPALPLGEAWEHLNVEQVLREEGLRWRERLFTPQVTLWTFLWQVLSPDGSCREAVSRLRAYLVMQGQQAVSPRTGSYCKARQRLPERVLARLTRESGHQLSAQAAPAWHWKGHRVKVVDGSTVSMPDTPANQQVYPQQARQQPGLGFPLARIVSVFCLACGSVVEFAVGPYHGKETGELALFRQLWAKLGRGDVVLADRFYSSYFMLASLQARSVAYVGRQHHARKTHFRWGQRLGREDHLVPWAKPQRPAWLDVATYQQLPDLLTVRELRVPVAQKGFRSRQLVVVTTLVDAHEISAADLATLYRHRWQAELDLRALKSTLGMDVLRGKTPEMVRKELWMHLLAYNLVRRVMAVAATQAALLPHAMSFQGARQAVNAFRGPLLSGGRRAVAALLVALRETVRAHQVGHRPDRVEPRAVKRRPKPYPLLTRPRAQARTRLLRKPTV